MKVGNSVRKAIDDWQMGEWEAATLHACNAVEGTAAKEFPRLGSRRRFVELLRRGYPILGPMGIPGIDLSGTRWPVTLRKPSFPDGPDLADVIYGIHRCCQAHGDELPRGFELIPDAAGPPGFTRVGAANGVVMLSDRILFGLLAVAVASPTNRRELVPSTYFLTFADEVLLINEYWGRRDDIEAICQSVRMPQVQLNFGDWMPGQDGEQ